ncbi:unnamed protein product [Trichogramma brassicae]|uniref:Chitin-binding type-2 domain-containing protein n=1 Tax=Trichogramma brassicae TaxID=86971 RepID=A0A6H5I0Y7_9HYME|nr:unnamed protein product [Trichogramma brassicae]
MRNLQSVLLWVIVGTSFAQNNHFNSYLNQQYQQPATQFDSTHTIEGVVFHPEGGYHNPCRYSSDPQCTGRSTVQIDAEYSFKISINEKSVNKWVRLQLKDFIRYHQTLIQFRSKRSLQSLSESTISTTGHTTRFYAHNRGCHLPSRRGIPQSMQIFLRSTVHWKINSPKIVRDSTSQFATSIMRNLQLALFCVIVGTSFAQLRQDQLRSNPYLNQQYRQQEVNTNNARRQYQQQHGDQHYNPYNQQQQYNNKDYQEQHQYNNQGQQQQRQPQQQRPRAFASSDGACPERNGRFPVASQCDAYIECVEGVPEQKLCPEGLVFNPEARFNNHCGYPIDVQCAGRSALPFLRFTCPAVGNALLAATTRFYASPHDCQHYYTCDENNRPRLHNCGADKAYNPLTSACDDAENVAGCGAPPSSISLNSINSVNKVNNVRVPSVTVAPVFDSQFGRGQQRHVPNTFEQQKNLPNRQPKSYDETNPFLHGQRPRFDVRTNFEDDSKQFVQRFTP